MTKFYLLLIALFGFALSKAQVSINITGVPPVASAMLDVSSTSKGMLIPQVSIDSLKDVTSIPSPANGLIVYNSTQPGVRNDMARGYYWYSTNAATWIRFADNFTDNKWKDGGLLGIQLRDTTDGVEIMDGYTGTSFNYNPKVKILKKIDSALLNAKNNIPVLVLTGVNRKTVSGWEPFQKTTIIFEMNYLNSIDGTSGTANNVAISSYIDRIGTNATTQTQGLAFYVTAPPQNTAVADTPSLAMFRHNVGVGAYPTDINNVTEGRVQITGFSNGDQLSLRHPSSINLKWGLYVSAIDSSLNFYSNGSLRANIDRVTGVFSALSDRNLKKNVTPLQPVLANINKLTPYIYNYTSNKDGDRKSIGFMAQDVEPYFPDLVFRKKERETGEPFMMMSYQSFGVIAIKAIQEQQEIITSQELRIKALEEEMRKIREKLGMGNVE
jgi:Chaperone of endosialidase